MQKKTKASRPLASALTVASTPEPKPAIPRSRSRKAPSPKSSAPSAEAPTLNITQTVEVTFALLNPLAQRVSVCGPFNVWSPEATPMNRQPDGLWKASLPLQPGRHEYKFVVDGQWLPDPNAPEQASNGFGTLNSVIEVRA